MTKSNHCFLAGEGAEIFARAEDFPPVPDSELTTSWAKAALERARREGLTAMNEIGLPEEENEAGVGTVGAVAMDAEGNLAAATSTGGLTGKSRGRVGDSPVNGAGVYADHKGDFAKFNIDSITSRNIDIY